MKVLVIPDIHLKPRMFTRAAELLEQNPATAAVCLMDIADDCQRQYDLEAYAAAYDAAIDFAEQFPETRWCWGNHDLSYPWNRRESGYSPVAPWLVCEKLRQLQEALPAGNQPAYLHRIDNVLFSHGGLADEFVRTYVPAKQYHDIDAVVGIINGLGPADLWDDLSPIWYRPQVEKGRMYKPRKLLQVVGHTPVEAIEKKGNVISCDVFSTGPDRTPIGTQEFLLLDTVTREYRGVQ